MEALKVRVILVPNSVKRNIETDTQRFEKMDEVIRKSYDLGTTLSVQDDFEVNLENCKAKYASNIINQFGKLGYLSEDNISFVYAKEDNTFDLVS